MAGRYSRRRVLRWSSASVFGLAGCAAPRAENGGRDRAPAVDGWPMFQRDALNTGRDPDETLPVYPDVSWTYETGGPVWGSPVVADGTVYIGSYDHHLYALDADGGDRKWRFETEDRIDATPAVHDGTVYAGSFDGSLYALDAATGERQWTHDARGIVRGSPTVVDDTVYVGGNCQSTECDFYYDDPEDDRGSVYALDRHTGDVRWEFETAAGLVGTPAVWRDTVYIGAEDATIYAIDALSGDEVWSYSTDDMTISSPAISDGRLFVGCNDGRVYALEAGTGDEVWVFDTGAQYVSSSPSICDGTVYVGSSGVPVDRGAGPVFTGILYAIDSETGDEVWSFETDAQEVGSTPAIVDGVIYVGSHSEDESYGALHAITTTARERWAHEVDGVGIGSSPAVADESLYVGVGNGTVIAFE